MELARVTETRRKVISILFLFISSLVLIGPFFFFFCLDVAEFLFEVVVFYFNCFIGNCLGQYTQEKEIGTLLMEVGQWCCLVLLVVSNRNFLVPAIAAV